MTFLCGEAREAGRGQSGGWPRPWWIRCDTCRTELPYAADRWQQTGADEHTCTGCLRERRAHGQMAFDLDGGAR
ncbi:MAG: hypothetical protein ABSG43_00240 [Solirubrobacteraceae bacterium]